MKERTLNWQLDELYKLVDNAFVKRAKEVKGAFTTGDYVVWRLNKIFGPHCWSFTILQGPEMIHLSDKSAYAQVVGRLEVTFADGTTAHQDDIGIWPLVATGARKGGTLDETAPERYETVCKAARTDALKNASYNLGTCFAPMSDGTLVRWLEQNETREHVNHLVEGQSPEEHVSDLFGIAEAREGDVEVVRREVARNAERREGNGGQLPASVRNMNDFYKEAVTQFSYPDKKSVVDALSNKLGTTVLVAQQNGATMEDLWGTLLDIEEARQQPLAA